MKPKLNPTTKRAQAGQTRALAVAPRSASSISDSELNAALHHVMLDKELDDLGAPKEQSGGKLSPFGRLRSVGPQLLADKRRLEWLIAHSAYIAHARDGEVCWVMMRPDEESDFETVDKTTCYTARESIDAAMRGPNTKT